MGEGVDSTIQLSEWVYGYQIIWKGSMFEGLKAREVFATMATGPDSNEGTCEMWSDYLERLEIDVGLELGVLFDKGATKHDEEKKEQYVLSTEQLETKAVVSARGKNDITGSAACRDKG